jgi:hypothetical protein
MTFSLRDNGGRRVGFDRRRFSYSGHIPERRKNAERRSGLDRRGNEERRTRLGQQAEAGWNSRKDRRVNIDRRDFMIL